jgi:large subunit ribosomal protein L18
MGKYNAKIARQRRHARVRTKVIGSGTAPRLCVFRSLNHIYAQLIDDEKGTTLTSASSCDPEIVEKAKDKKKMDTANLVGSKLGERAQSQGVKKVVFDRGGYKYHGRVKALADAARKAGLEF